MSRRETLFIPLLLALVPSLVYWEVFRGDLLLPTDWVYQEMEPWRRLDRPTTVVNSRIKDAMLIGYALDVVSARSAAEGDALLWNRYAGGGMPHLATGFPRVLYPFFWIYGVLPPMVARQVEILLHLFLAALFAFVFLRRIHCNLGGAFLGAVIFSLNPSIIHRAEMSFQLPTLVWFPLLLYFIEAVATTGRTIFVAGLAVTVAFQLTAGYYPDIFIQLLGAAAYGVVRLATSSSPATALRRAVLCLSGALLGAALAAPFIFPSFDFIFRANRPVTTVTSLAESGLGWSALLTMFTPWLRRSTLFIGLAFLVFVPLAFRRERRSVAWGLFAVFLTGLAVGAGSPVLIALEAAIPTVKNLRYVHTLISVGSFGLALLAGVGLSEYVRERSSVVVRAAWIALVGAALGSVLHLFDAGRELSTLLQLPVAAASLLVLVLALELMKRNKLRSTAFAGLLLVSAGLELGTYARSVNPRIDPGRFPPFPEFESVRFLRSDPDLFRVAPLPRSEGPFWPNTLGAYGIEDVSAYQSLIPGSLGRYARRLYLYAGGWRGAGLFDDGDSAGNWVSLAGYRPSHLLRIWNIKYFVLPEGSANPDPGTLELVYDGEVRIFRLENWLPRAWLAEDAIVVPDERGAYAKLLSPSFNPERTVVLEEEPTCFFARAGAGVPRGSSPDVDLLEYESERVELRTRSPRPSFLFLSQSYDPGWKAEVDGEAVPLLRANANFQAVPLGAGAHRVILRYRPDAYWWGWLAFGLGSAVCFLWMLPFQKIGAIPAPLAVVLFLIPVSVGAVGWIGGREANERRGCGQLHVSARYSADSPGELVALSNGSLVSHRLDVPGTWRWPVPSSAPSMLRFRLARSAAAARSVVWTARARGSGTEPVAAGRLPPGGRRWHHRDIPLPRQSQTIEIDVSSSSPPSSVELGAPTLFTPRSHRRSIVLFFTGPVDDEPDLSRFGSERFRVLLQLGAVRAQRAVAFDETYPSADEQEFSRRLLALATDLYRVSSLLVVNVGADGDRADFGRRQLELLRAELERLGLSDRHVEIRVFGGQ